MSMVDGAVTVTGTSGRTIVAALLRLMLRTSGRRGAAPRADADGPGSGVTSPRDRSVVEAVWPPVAPVAPTSVLVVTGLASDELPPGTSIGEVVALVRAQAAITTGTVVVNADDAQALAACGGARVPLLRASWDDRTADAFVQDGDVVVRDHEATKRVARLADTRFAVGGLGTDLLVAAAAALACGAGASAIARAVAHYRFTADHHEVLGEIGGVTWVNDAAATSPGRAAAMLDRSEQPVVLIAGGIYGGQPLSRWARTVASRATYAVLFGQAGAALADVLVATAGRTRIVRCADLDDAIQVAQRVALPGDRVLFAPGCLPDGDGPGGRLRAAVGRMQPRREAA